MNDFMFTLFPVFFVIIFIVVISAFIFIFVRIIKETRYNNSQPRLTVNAKVVSKRTRVSGERTSTFYYVTFEVESGDRMELVVKGHESGMIIEGDRGKLTFQGNRFLGFERG